ELRCDDAHDDSPRDRRISGKVSAEFPERTQEGASLKMMSLDLLLNHQRRPFRRAARALGALRETSSPPLPAGVPATRSRFDALPTARSSTSAAKWPDEKDPPAGPLHNSASSSIDLRVFASPSPSRDGCSSAAL